ncbi:condensation domain-containing protein [Streptomyces sp. R35]|uniref:Condensation domain-containing protein n=1 Tax=Streptomyces sp. R35 TaxID=3238630 RepID=A0AB39SF13_9ACTN
MSAPVDKSRLAGRLARLSPAQRAALTARLAERDGPQLRRRPGPRDRFPLGMDQERLWILDQLDPGTTTYTLGYGLRVAGAFDLDTFTRAADAVVLRHELLRANAESEGGRPYLRVHPDRRAEISYADLSAADPSQDSDERIERRRQEFIAEQVRRPFDLARDPVLRLAVAKVAEGDHQIVETMPHSFVDQWSYVRLNDELLEHYRALSEDREPQVAELPVQFGDWAHWQRERFAGPHGERHREFWRTFLDGVPERLALPYDHSPDTADHAGEHYGFILDREVGLAFAARARAARTTPATAMTAAYAALLYERTGLRDLVVGIPAATRGEPETTPLIGFLLTSIPLRIRLPENPTPNDVLTATAAAAAAVADHREVPFGEIVQAVAPDRSATRHPLLQTMLVQLDIDDSKALGLPGAEVYANAVPEGVSTMDLTTAWWQVGDVVYGRMEYRTALFDRATVASLAGRLLQIVEQFAERPDEPLRRPAPRLAQPPVSLLSPPAEAGPRAEPGRAADEDLRRVTDAWCEVLGTDRAAPEDVFFTSGGTSLLAVRLAHRLREAGFTATLKDVFTHPVLGRLAETLGARRAGAPQSAPVPAAGPLGPEQEMLLGRGLDRVESFAHSYVLEAAGPLDADRLRDAAKAVVRAHPTLTTAYQPTDGSGDLGPRIVPGEAWRWSAEPAGTDPEPVVAAQRADFDLAAGVLFAVSHLPGASGVPDRVVLGASHLVIDGMSWGIVIADLARAYRGEPLTGEKAGYAEHAAAVRALDPAPHAAYWRAQLAGAGAYRWSLDGPNVYGGERQFEVEVELPAEWHGPLEPVALTAVARALRPWAPDEQASYWLIGLGRDPLATLPGWDPDRAVGYYSAPFPLRVPLTGGSAADDLRATAAALRAVPDSGKTFGLLGCAADTRLREEFATLGEPRVIVNYVGELADPANGTGGLFTRSTETAATGNEDVERPVDVDVAIALRDGALVLRWLHNPDAVDPEAVRATAELAARELRDLLTAPRQPQDPDGVPGVTGVMEETMERLFERLSRERRDRQGVRR